ncbi:holo-ACP synthase [Paenisporosarcina sp. OV554]|uniref:holo-ACP synthase n=1 Tax=Paenisporosarcina sp. OV554 TaxID=2135694 RepID=UPI000D3CFCDC|nr:holo-ACP synthase [Paenisporosarcina sp. OV554]PUB14466.1 holo-[acyl-carrier protein] synthase [Paenisporosarcina sp. OV554]
MIKGIGLDVTEIERITVAHDRSSKFKERILTIQEIKRFEKLSEMRQLEFLAGRFAAKEAFAKALGTGIGKSCSFHDIEVLPNEVGKPMLFFKGIEVKGHISITHTKQFAAAQVILVE